MPVNRKLNSYLDVVPDASTEERRVDRFLGPDEVVGEVLSSPEHKRRIVSITF